MKKFKLASVFVLLCVCSSVFAQENKTDRAIRAVKELCLTGTQFDLKADAKGNLTLRKLLPGGEGAVSVNVRESSGAAAIFDEKIRQIADEDIRRCIQPYIKQIIDAILAENPRSNPQIIQYVGRVRDKDTHLPVQDAKISLEGQGVPLIEHTDSEGIYRFTVKPVNDAVRVRVEAKGYEVYTRFITLSPENPGLEDIPLVRLRSGIDLEKEVPKRADEPGYIDSDTNKGELIQNGNFEDHYSPAWYIPINKNASIKHHKDFVRILFDGVFNKEGMDSKDVEPYQVVKVVELCQVVNVPNPSNLIFNLRIKISDFNNEGFPAAALTFIDHLDRKAFQITFTPDKNYKPEAGNYLYRIRNGFIENITISLLEYAREKKMPLDTYKRATKAKISFYIAGPSSSRCTECIVQIYHVSLIEK